MEHLLTLGNIGPIADWALCFQSNYEMRNSEVAMKPLRRMIAVVPLMILTHGALIGGCAEPTPPPPSEPTLQATCAGPVELPQPQPIPLSAGEAQGFLSVLMPKGTSSSHVVLAAAGELGAQNHALIEGSAGPTLVTNAGEVTTAFANHSTLAGTLVSQAPIHLANNASILQAVTTSVPVDTHATATIGGVVVENAVLTPPLEIKVPVTFAASTVNHDIAPNNELVLSPGAYHSVRVAANAKLTLAAGTYTLDELDVMPQSTVVIDTQNGPVLIYVRTKMHWAGNENDIGPGGRLFIGYLGSTTLNLKTTLNAAVLAPNATVTLEKSGSNSEYHGLYWAKNIQIGPHVHVVHEPFQHWSLIFPPTPTLKCVTRFDDDHWSALFGYINNMDIDLTFPAGEMNRFVVPGDDKKTIETFAPGAHPSVFFVPFDGTSLTWILGQQAVTATQCAPRCTLADYPSPADGPVTEIVESAGPAGPSMRDRFTPDQVWPGRTIEPAPLPWGTSGQFTHNSPLKLTIVGGNTFGSDDGCGRPELYVKVHINGSPVFDERWDFPVCPAAPAACGFQIDSRDFVVDIPEDQPTVAFDVELWEADSGLCGSDDHYLSAHLIVDNTNGLVTGTIDNFDGDGSNAALTGTSSFGPTNCFTNNCEIENLGSRFLFSVEPSGFPRICANWSANFVDVGFGEDFVTEPGTQKVPASFALASLTLARNGQEVTVTTPLDEDGCFPRDLSPDLEDLMDPEANDLSLTLELKSQFCFDSEGLDCLDASQQPRGVRFIIGRNPLEDETPLDIDLPNPTPVSFCTELVANPVGGNPFCPVRPFDSWIGGSPPSTIMLDPPHVDDESRSSAVVSHILRQEHQTNGALGLSGETKIVTNAACSLVNSQPSSCVDSSNRLRIRSTPSCSGNEPFEICRNNDSRWKTIVAHEVGHVMQRRATGLWFVAYGFGAGAQFTVDHPGAPLLCQCQHITSDADTNNKHCMQSLERPGAAQVEGFAQYFAAKVWNDLDEPECTIPYYKQFIDTTCRVAQEDCSLHPDWANNGLVINSPPVPISCIDPQKWRNRNCLSGVFGPDEVPTDLSTEMDWMGFYYKLTNPQTANRLTTGQLFETYRRACGAVTGGACNGSVESGWRTVPNTNPPVSGVKEGAEELFALGFINNAQRQQFVQLGDTYGVSEETQP